MPQAVAHRPQFPDPAVELVRFGGKRLPIDARPSIGSEHPRDVVQRKAGGAAERDERQPFEHARIEATAQALPANRGNKPLFLIEPQRRGRKAGALCNGGDIHVRDPLTSS